MWNLLRVFVLGYPSLSTSMAVIATQKEVISIQRRHIQELNERVRKLERQSDGLMSLI